MIAGTTGQAKLCGPVHSMGHTANVIANRMIVIFGHSPKYGYLSTVQVLNKHIFLIRNKVDYNRPWWPSGLEHVSNSSRHSVADPVSNPHRDYSIDRSESEMACHYSNSRAPGDMCGL